eukprot:7526850-Ditylum_brightwellii.AAC.2
MMHKPRHISMHKWIAKVVKLNNYLMEFSTPTGIEAKKLEDEEILEMLENRIPTSWTFQMDKEGFDASSSRLKKNASQKKLRKAAQLVRAIPREEGSTNPNVKHAKRLTVTGDEILHDVILMTKDVSIASTMGIATTPQMSVGSPSNGTKDTHDMKGKTDPATARRCVSEVARPSLVRPCLMEARIYTWSLMRKLLQFLTARKRRISTSLKLYLSCLEATRAMTVTATPGSATPQMKR